MADQFEIDLNEGFDHLSRAPVVEAILDIRALAGPEWEEVSATKNLSALLPDYPSVVSQHVFSQQMTLRKSETPSQNAGWLGLKCASSDGRNLAEFGREGFAYHRLPQYEGWEKFSGEANRLWRMFVKQAHPSELQRIGVRFIGRIEMSPQEGNFEHYIQPSPVAPRGIELPFLGFFHQDTLHVPGYPYVINVIRTVQPPQNSTQGFSLILDIDVGTNQAFTLEDAKLAERLKEMRWLKNKVFFGSITSKVLEKYK